MCLQTLSFTDIIDTVVRQKICYDINNSSAAEAQIKIAALICINDKKYTIDFGCISVFIRYSPSYMRFIDG